MITVIALRERTWLEPQFDYRQWEHLCRNYGADLLLFDAIEEVAALTLPPPVIVWDEAGATDHTDFSHPEDGVYIFGKTHVNGMFKGIACDDSVRIVTPAGSPCLFGVPAAAVALELREQQWR